MRKKLLAAAGVAGLLVLAGCQSTSSSETEQLKQQIAQLEQQVTELEKGSAASDTVDDAANAPADAADDTADAANTTDDTAAASTETGTNTADTSAGNTGSTIPAIEDLTAKVDAFVQKADEESLSSAEKTLENYFILKQEGDAIDDELDYYEDSLEFDYRNGALTRDEYRTKERELDLLEDKLDAAEDTLEWIYGIDD